MRYLKNLLLLLTLLQFSGEQNPFALSTEETGSICKGQVRILAS